jgi:hypothetical protein
MDCIQPGENIYFLYLFEVNFLSKDPPGKRRKRDFSMFREISLASLNS